jgi:hypothetical protein
MREDRQGEANRHFFSFYVRKCLNTDNASQIFFYFTAVVRRCDKALQIKLIALCTKRYWLFFWMAKEV